MQPSRSRRLLGKLNWNINMLAICKHVRQYKISQRVFSATSLLIKKVSSVDFEGVLKAHTQHLLPTVHLIYFQLEQGTLQETRTHNVCLVPLLQKNGKEKA